MKETNYARHLDSTGRLVIPARLREELQLVSGDPYTFFTHEIDGTTYLCIQCPKAESELERAKRILLEHGFKIYQ